MTSWLRWVSSHMDSIRKNFPEVFKELRAKASGNGFHHKLPEQAAYLQYAMLLASEWMHDMGILNETTRKQLEEISWGVLSGNMSRQSEMVQAEDPVNIFMDTLETLIVQGKVNIKNRLTDENFIGDEKEDLVGYLDAEIERLYLIPGATWNAFKKYLNSEGTHFSVSKNTLFKMLRDKKLVTHEGDKSSSVVKVKDNEGTAKSTRVLQMEITDKLRDALLTKLPYQHMMRIINEG
jgi:hypothetical protein